MIKPIEEQNDNLIGIGAIPHESSELSSSNAIDDDNPIENNSNNKKSSDDRNYLLLAEFMTHGMSINNIINYFFYYACEIPLSSK